MTENKEEYQKCMKNDKERPPYRRHQVSNFAPDGGWGWMVVLGSFLVHLLMGGMNRSFGVVYIELRRKFNSSAALTNWVGGTAIAARMIFGPLASWLCVRYHPRTLIIFGGLFLSLSFFLSAFATSTEYMLFSYSVVAGIGGLLSHLPSLVQLVPYFDRRRALAMGMATCGVGVGVFVFPPLIEYMFEKYGFFGTELIISAILLNCCVAGALHRPLPKLENKPTEEQMGNITDSPNNAHTNNKNINKKSSFSLVRNPVASLYACSSSLWYIAVTTTDGLVSDMAIAKGIPDERAVLLISIGGAADTIGRFLLGFIFDIPLIRKHRKIIYNFNIFLFGTCYFFLPLCDSFVTLALCLVLAGVLSGGLLGLRSVIIADLLGLDNLAPGLGLTLFSIGCGSLIGPFITGLLRDVTDDYTASFMLSGALSTVGALLYGIALMCHSKRPQCIQWKYFSSKEIIQTGIESV